MLRSESRQTAPHNHEPKGSIHDNKSQSIALSGTPLGETTQSTGSTKRPDRAPRVRSGQKEQTLVKVNKQLRVLRS